MLFETIDDLLNHVEKDILPTLEKEIAEFCSEILYESVRNTVYANTISDFAESGFKDSITSITNNIGTKNNIHNETNIYFDPQQMTKSYPSFYGNGSPDNRDMIIEWLNNGHGGYYQGKPIYYAPKRFIEKAQALVNKTGTKEAKKILKKAGYKLTTLKGW